MRYRILLVFGQSLDILRELLKAFEDVRNLGFVVLSFGHDVLPYQRIQPLRVLLYFPYPFDDFLLENVQALTQLVRGVLLFRHLRLKCIHLLVSVFYVIL